MDRRDFLRGTFGVPALGIQGQGDMPSHNYVERTAISRMQVGESGFTTFETRFEVRDDVTPWFSPECFPKHAVLPTRDALNSYNQFCVHRVDYGYVLERLESPGHKMTFPAMRHIANGWVPMVKGTYYHEGSTAKHSNCFLIPQPYNHPRVLALIEQLQKGHDLAKSLYEMKLPTHMNSSWSSEDYPPEFMAMRRLETHIRKLQKIIGITEQT